MRNAFILALLTLFFTSLDYSGYKSDSINLRYPIYFVTDKSFWSGCEDAPDGYKACHDLRLQRVKNGAGDWFQYFDGPTRPKIVVVESKADLPYHTENNPIYIKIQKDYCGMADDTRKAVACYFYDRTLKLKSLTVVYSQPTITFDLPENITSSNFAHEFGHAMDRGHSDMPENIYITYTHDTSSAVPKDVKVLQKNIYSVMSYTRDSNHVTPVDIKLLCKIHPECPPHEDTWCQGKFWDNDRCPSSSYEEGEEMFQTGQFICPEEK